MHFYNTCVLFSTLTTFFLLKNTNFKFTLINSKKFLKSQMFLQATSFKDKLGLGSRSGVGPLQSMSLFFPDADETNEVS